MCYFHGDPKCNKEVAMESQLLPLLSCWVEKRRKEERKLGFLFLCPSYGPIRQFVAQNKSRYDFYDPLGLIRFVMAQ